MVKGELNREILIATVKFYILLKLFLFLPTSAHHDVALEVNPVALWKLEHREERRLGRALQLVVGELGHDVGVGASNLQNVRTHF